MTMEHPNKAKRTHISWLLALCLLMLPMGMSAQNATDSVATVKDSVANVMDSVTIKDVPGDTTQIVTADGKVKPTKYIPTEEDLKNMKQTFFQGFTVSADVLNLGLYFLSSYGNLEASLRINLLNTYFPVAEIGLGRCNKTNYTTTIHYSTNAPYFKVGIDYNLLKDKWQANKLLFGLRYGFSNFNYSFDGETPQTDPIWKESQPLDVNSLNATSHYLEVVFGCQVKIWKFIHMGWSARFKKELHTTKSLYSHPYYIPGYGTTVGGTYWGATYNISFDLNWGKKKPSIKQAVENAVNEIKQAKADESKDGKVEEEQPKADESEDGDSEQTEQKTDETQPQTDNSTHQADDNKPKDDQPKNETPTNNK